MRNYFLFLLALVLLSCSREEDKTLYNIGVIPQDSSVLIPVKKQLIAYNLRDIENFTPNFADSIKLYRMGSDEPFCMGQKELRNIYSDLFQEKTDLNCSLVNRIVCGDLVIDEERVIGLDPDREVHAVAIYEVRDSLIQKVWFIKNR